MISYCHIAVDMVRYQVYTIHKDWWQDVVVFSVLHANVIRMLLVYMWHSYTVIILLNQNEFCAVHRCFAQWSL